MYGTPQSPTSWPTGATPTSQWLAYQVSSAEWPNTIIVYSTSRTHQNKFLAIHSYSYLLIILIVSCALSETFGSHISIVHCIGSPWAVLFLHFHYQYHKYYSGYILYLQLIQAMENILLIVRISVQFLVSKCLMVVWSLPNKSPNDQTCAKNRRKVWHRCL